MKICLLCGQIFTPKFLFSSVFLIKKESEPRLCEHCQAKFEKLNKNRCQICSQNLAEGKMCQDCLSWRSIYGENLLRNHAIYRYNAEFHDLMVAYKRYGDYILREILQELCQKELSKLKFDYFIPVPTSPEHQKRRQFDTIIGIYEDLLPLTCLLSKQEGQSAQGEKNRIERLKTKQSFVLKQEAKKITTNNQKSFLLLDDIYTTGRTLYHARDKLLEAFPNAQIESFTICR